MESDGALRVPPHILDAAGIGQGTELSIALTQDGVSITRVIDHDPDQAWFWTDQWQDGEFEATLALREGRRRRYLTDEEFDAELDRREHELRNRDAPARADAR